MAGIYFHIPFCKQACYYCDFHFSTNTSVKDEMVEALMAELDLRSGYLQEEVNTIYFGGGTPSLLSATELEQLLTKVRRIFRVSANPEITLEANPDDLSAAKLRALYDGGINRLSIGIQSFDDGILRFLNRAHDSRAATQCLDDARKSGFRNISVDLIYAIPGQSSNVWLANIDKAMTFQPEHISAYALTIEQRTVFGRWAAKGQLKALDDDVTADQMELLADTLAKNGYEQYEVSNFARAGFYSRHNSSYWQGIPYLGVGPAAHSYDIRSRQFNVANNHVYIRQIGDGIIPATVETLTTERRVNDYLLTSLRTNRGTDFTKISRDFGVDLFTIHENYIRTLEKNGLAVLDGTRLVLTRRGLALADQVASDFFIVD